MLLEQELTILKKWIHTQVRETLDHSIMYIFAVALEDGAWHHINLTLLKELEEKALLNYGIKFQLERIKNGLKNIIIQIQKKNVLEEKLLLK